MAGRRRLACASRRKRSRGGRPPPLATLQGALKPPLHRPSGLPYTPHCLNDGCMRTTCSAAARTRAGQRGTHGPRTGDGPDFCSSLPALNGARLRGIGCAAEGDRVCCGGPTEPCSSGPHAQCGSRLRASGRATRCQKAHDVTMSEGPRWDRVRRDGTVSEGPRWDRARRPPDGTMSEGPVNSKSKCRRPSSSQRPPPHPLHPAACQRIEFMSCSGLGPFGWTRAASAPRMCALCNAPAYRQRLSA